MKRIFFCFCLKGLLNPERCHTLLLHFILLAVLGNTRRLVDTTKFLKQFHRGFDLGISQSFGGQTMKRIN
jgi:hypothetical protein